MEIDEHGSAFEEWYDSLESTYAGTCGPYFLAKHAWEAAQQEHPAVAIIREARAILTEHVQPIGISKAETIAKLLELLDRADATGVTGGYEKAHTG